MTIPTLPVRSDLGLLLVRVALAAPFLVHGWSKLSDLSATVISFAGLGLPAPLAWVVALIEFFGGIAVLAGVGSRVAGALLAAVMVGAIVTVKWEQGFVGGYEYPLVLLLAALAIVAAGPGRYAFGAKAASGCCGSGVCKR